MRRWVFLFTVVILVLLAGVGCIGVPALAARSYGPPASNLSTLQIIQYSARLLWDDGLLNTPRDRTGSPQTFTVQPGESILSIASRLEQAGLIRDASAMRDYLVYTGLDTSVQAGNYQFNPGMSIVDIAHAMQDATPSQVTFVVLPGWRMEEIAAALPTSGFEITPEAFLAAARLSPHQFDYLEGAASLEGFLYPDSYILPRITNVNQLLSSLVLDFNLHLTTDLREGFDRQDLSIYQAVTLASLVQREAIHAEEQPVIASVFLNRLKAGMMLDSDPTVQYALGYDDTGQTWWTNPLGLEDLKIDSPYNTYIHTGLPPGPIDNPGLSALQAVASPAETNYLYFRARCDGSGYHLFAESFSEHLQNACP